MAFSQIIKATWRDTTLADRESGRIGVEFETDSGNVWCLLIDKDNARHLRESLQEHVRADKAEFLSTGATEKKLRILELAIDHIDRRMGVEKELREVFVEALGLILTRQIRA
jgi:hypothetical protein